MTETQKQSIINKYLENEAKELKALLYPMLMPIGGISQKDYDDFFSNSSLLLWKLLDTYDESTGLPFQKYLESCLKRKCITWGMRDTNRFKRKNQIRVRDEQGRETYQILQDVSIDTPLEDKGGATLGDILVSDFDIDLETSNIIFSDEMENYLESLTYMQRKIADMIMENYSPEEIKEKLNITENQYIKLFNDMKTFEKMMILKRNSEKRNSDKEIGEDILMNECNTQTLEKSKADRLSISSIIKKINNQTIRFNHPLQRPSDQWTSVMKGNLVSDILQGNPIPPLVFAEEVINGLAIIWDLDGKQRATNCYAYKNDGFKIAKNIRRWNISYQATLKDEWGKPILDSNGFPQSERREFDIRGKLFSKLPEELQDRFLDYNFEITQYINCSKDDIAYHIARYNEGKPMSPSHKGIIRLGENFASTVKSISAMPFFKEKGGYKVSEGSNGTVDRVVVESIMASNFLDNWKKDVNEMCEFIKSNATSEIFENFEDMVERIYKIDNEDVLSMFDSKDSFIYFALYGKFINTGLPDQKFVEFMEELSRSLHKKEVKGITYDELCFDKETGKARSTKDKYIVIPKLELLETLMMEYLQIDHTDERYCDEEGILDFLRETIGQIPDHDNKGNNIERAIEHLDLDTYTDDFEVYSLNVNNTSKLMEKENRLSLIALIAYGYQNDIVIDEWFKDYFDRNHTYLMNQKANFLRMKEDLNQYCAAKNHGCRRESGIVMK